jgi:hypothetical protein
MRVISLLPILAASAFAMPSDFSVIVLKGLEVAYPPEYPPECPATFPCYGIVISTDFEFTSLILLTGKDYKCCPPG